LLRFRSHCGIGWHMLMCWSDATGGTALRKPPPAINNAVPSGSGKLFPALEFGASCQLPERLLWPFPCAIVSNQSDP